MNWDTIIAVLIILALILAGWAKVSKQTIPELVGGIVDSIKGRAEDSVEEVREITF